MNRSHLSLLLASLFAAPLAVAAPPETDGPTDGFALIMTGFLVQWPTLLTLVLYPVMLITYVRLAISEERDTRSRFGAAYEQYLDAVPRFFPRRRRPMLVAS